MGRPRVLLRRLAYVPGMGTFGQLLIPSRQLSLWTVEQDWEQNKVNVSCIPEGTYHMKRGRYHRGGYDTFEVLDVPGREHIKIHKANTMDELQGCIAPGVELGCVDGKWAVVNSRLAFDRLMEALHGYDEAVLTISSVFTCGEVGILPYRWSKTTS